MAEIKIDAKATEYLKNKIGGEGGGLILVDELPELGDESLLYKTPDGKIWSCTNGTGIICDLKVGESYKLVETISTDYVINTLMGEDGIIGSNTTFVEGQQYPKFQVITDAMTGNQDFAYCPVNDRSYAYYHIDYEVTPDTVNLQYKGNVTKNPDIEITQYFIDNLANDGTIEDLIPLFQNSSHEGEISTWTQVNGGGSGSRLYLHRIYLNNPTECDTIDLVMNIYTPKAEAYTDVEELKTYLISAGLNNTAEELEGNTNFNGILCTRIAVQELSSVILRRITDSDEWIINVGGNEQTYLALSIAEDAVMAI